jgi:hypothetical protein
MSDGVCGLRRYPSDEAVSDGEVTETPIYLERIVTNTEKLEEE